LLRCYQLLLSSSAAALQYRENVAIAEDIKYQPKLRALLQNPIFVRVRNGIYTAAMNEWYIDALFGRFIVRAFRHEAASAGDVRPGIAVAGVFVTIGELAWCYQYHVLGDIWFWLLFALACIPIWAFRLRRSEEISVFFIQLIYVIGLGVYVGYGNTSSLPYSLKNFWAFHSIIAAILSLLAAAHIRSTLPLRMGHAFFSVGSILLAAFLMAGQEVRYSVLITLFGLGSGILLALASLVVMLRRRSFPEPDLMRGTMAFLGMATAFPRLSVLFLLGSMAAVTFPYTAAFRGEDMILNTIYGLEPVAAVAGGIVSVLAQIMLIVAFAQGYFGTPWSPVRIADVDIKRSTFICALVVCLVVSLTSLFL